jgi:hypothetical protein
MVVPVETLPERDGAAFTLARVRDYWLGGHHHREADRRFADNTAACAPHIPYQVRAQRALLGRMVRYLLGQGVRQFLDLGSGIPAMGHVHELARGAARVVYVDNDAEVAADSESLLAGEDDVALVRADLRKPDEVLSDPRLRRLLDLSEPVAVLVIATLQHIPDSDDPVAIVAEYVDAMCPGSFLGVSHYGPDNELVESYRRFDGMNLGHRPEVTLRDQTSLAVFFAGLEIVEPGIVPMVLWRPEPDDDTWRNPQRLPIYAGVGRCR